MTVRKSQMPAKPWPQPPVSKKRFLRNAWKHGAACGCLCSFLHDHSTLVALACRFARYAYTRKSQRAVLGKSWWPCDLRNAAFADPGPWIWDS